MNIHREAINRYAAMIGDRNEQAEAARAASDREDFGAAYTPKSSGSFDKTCLMIRFMHEVCNIPLWQARECVTIVIEEQRAFCLPGIVPAADLATKILFDNGNVLIAEATAQLYVKASIGTVWHRYWKEVLAVLTYGCLADDCGADDADATTH